MSDRELLEFALKATDYWSRHERQFLSQEEIDSGHLWISDQDLDGVKYDPVWTIWNPLTDDGDALRLAVKLSLHVRVCRRSVLVEMREFGDDIHIRLGVDPYSATRRAIVLAAAEIGKTRSE
ncbi:hypothetical protein [Achromobacter anxifer]|uniref:hypothetical protein n=1 Tax=Achromobacter anxifer TaxID=1287737 RepID=UPI001581EF0E|nr:hypothetical protein [Achromobacter anxifer]